MVTTMQTTTIEELNWLHDSDLLSVMYDTSGDAGWSIRLTMRCPVDSGHPPWEGKVLVLRAGDIVRSTHMVCGIAGGETVDYIDSEVSHGFHESALRGMPMDTQFNFEFTIHFVSGSVLEVICQDLQVEVG